MLHAYNRFIPIGNSCRLERPSIRLNLQHWSNKREE